MAEVITRFKLETTQFNSKLRDAAKGLQEVARVAQTGGKDFVNFSQKAIESARALGQTASGATNVKDKLKDLVGSFNDAAKAYNSLSQAQQQSDFGKELANSLSQLKVRINEAKDELYSLGDAVKSSSEGGGGLFSSDKLSGMLQVFGGNLMTKAFDLATGAAMNFVNSIKEAAVQGIEMAKSGEGIRIAFERLNDPSLLYNLREATHNTVTDLELMKAAVKFNDFKLPLNELGTMLAFAQQKAKDTGQSIDYMVDSIVTGLGRKSLMILDNLGLSAAEIKEKMKETGDMTSAVGEIIRQQMSSAGEYVETAADRATQADVELKNAMEELGRTLIPLEEQGVGMWNALEVGAIKLLNDGIKPLVPALLDLKATISDIATDVSDSSIWNTYIEGIKSVADQVARTTPQLSVFYNLLQSIRGNNNDMGAGVGDISGALINYGEVSSIPEVTVTGNKPKKTKKSGGSKVDTKAKIQQQFDTAMAKANIAAEEFKFPDLSGPSEAWTTFKDAVVKGSEEIGDSMNFTKWTKDFDPYTMKMNEMNKALKQQQMAFSMSAQAASNFGSALAGLEDPGAKAAGTVIAAIANIALGFGTAAAQASSMGPLGWIAYVAAGLGVLATAISTVHSLTGYAEGGMIKGNSYSGDNLMAQGPNGMIGLNAGEVVLNAAQQSTLANNLQNNGGQTVRVIGKISGTDILLSADRTLKTQGKQLAVWNG